MTTRRPAAEPVPVPALPEDAAIDDAVRRSVVAELLAAIDGALAEGRALLAADAATHPHGDRAAGTNPDAFAA